MDSKILSDIRGLICPLVTPFDNAGDVDIPALRNIVDFLLERGVHVLFPAGSTGEGPLLTVAERKQVAETVLDQNAGRVPVIVHTGCLTTRETIELTAHAHAAGASAASIITPFFFTYTEEQVYQHYLAVARAVPDMPIFIYAFPGNAKNDVAPALVQRLRQSAPNIVGIKSSNPDLMRFQEYVTAGGPDFVALCGADGVTLPGLVLGSRGQVSGNSNAVPELFRALYDAYMRGDLVQAQRYQQSINRVRAVLRDGMLPAYFKAALTIRGVPAGRVRAPMRELTPEEWNELEANLAQFGLEFELE